jgi:predicted AlkP superfamily pyrophosphatase or phosphodiesterase
MAGLMVLNVVGLTPGLIGPNTPRIAEFANRGRLATIGAVVPAVTCSVQSTYLTGLWPAEHGAVGNGWYFRDDCEVRFWRQSNKLVAGEKIWEAARRHDPQLTTANLFWWYNMYATADFSVTPRPMYPSDGRKLPDVYSHPADLRDRLQAELGTFPLFQFWGPATTIASTKWIADAAQRVVQWHSPGLALVYLPHLDYGLQRHGPDLAQVASDLREVDAVVGQLLDFCASRGYGVAIVSEYGIAPVQRPVHLNRALREAGLLRVRQELGRELLDAGASDAFAVADHQVAHIYVNEPAKLAAARRVIESVSGVARVYDAATKPELHLDHPRAGELVALADPDAWFTYYYWLDDRREPDFARTVDIHRKPGYDPAELFIDPALRLPKLKIAKTLFKRKLGFRSLLEVIPDHAEMVRGSHGLPAATVDESPVFISSARDRPLPEVIRPTDVKAALLDLLFAVRKR